MTLIELKAKAYDLYGHIEFIQKESQEKLNTLQRDLAETNQAILRVLQEQQADEKEASKG